MQYCEDCIHCCKQIFPYICREAQRRGLDYIRCESIRARQPFGTCSMYSYGKQPICDNPILIMKEKKK